MPIAVPFPTEQPAGFDWLDGEPAFDESQHLALEAPASTTSLHELGYTNAEIAGKCTTFACSAPFRVLSDEGAEVMLEVARRLLAFARPANTRIERMVRGGCYRSKWLRDLCTSPALTEHMCSVYGIAVAPHPMPHHLGHLNYDPLQLGRAVDKWHHDTLPLDFVLNVTDPAKVAGGRFEYFVGTRGEAAELAKQGLVPPRERVVTPEFPGPGYAIALHGDMVVHRAAPLDQRCERISMVNGYVAMDAWTDSQSRTQDLVGIDHDATIWSEWGRFAAWRAQARLATVANEMPTECARDEVIARLEAAIADAQTALAQMREPSKHELTHYGG